MAGKEDGRATLSVGLAERDVTTNYALLPVLCPLLRSRRETYYTITHDWS